VRTLSEIPVSLRREGTLKGGYVAKKESGKLEVIILASGSEVQWAMDVAKDMPGARVVSMPSMFRFDKQSKSYR
jgi:transketolase